MPNLSTIFATVVGVLLLVILVLGLIIHFESGKIDTLSAQNAVCMAQNHSLDESIKVQNAAVDKLVADQKAITEAAEKAEKAALQRDVPLSRQIDALKAAKSSGEACAAADGLFNSYLRGKK